MTLWRYFETVSKDFRIYKAEIQGETPAPIDLNGPQNFPLDEYQIRIILYLPFASDMVNQIEPPALDAPGLMVTVLQLDTGSPSDTEYVLSRPAYVQAVFFIASLSPLVAVFPRKQTKFYIPVPAVANMFLTYYFQWIPSRNTLSYFDTIMFVSTFAAVLWNVRGCVRRSVRRVRLLCAKGGN